MINSKYRLLLKNILRLGIIAGIVLCVLPFFPASPANADGPSVKITAPIAGESVTLDYNSFNIKITYHVDVEKNAGTIKVYFSSSSFGTRLLEEANMTTSNPSGVYPCTFSYERNVWVPSPPPGIYRLRAEMWRSEYVPAKKDFTGGYWQAVEIIATDEISITIPGVVSTTAAPTEAPTTAVVPTTAAPNPDLGSIYVYSSPGDAQIWLNGQYKVNSNYDSNNPYGFTRLTPGTYYVTLRKQGYIDYTEKVDLQANQIYDVRAVLEQGTTPTGWVIITSDPADANAYFGSQRVDFVSGLPITGVPPGTYDLRLKKDGYEDWYDTIAVTAGDITQVNAQLPPKSGGFPVGPVAGGAAAVAVVGGGIGLLRARGKGVVDTSDLYKQWWNSATPAQRKDWQNFENYLNSRLGNPYLQTYQDSYGRPSWGSAYSSWEKEVKGGSKESFEDWVKRQAANQQISNEMWARAEANKNFRPKEIVEATDNYARYVRFDRIKKAVAGDATLSAWAEDAGKIILKDGKVDANELARFEGDLKYWVQRDKMIPQAPDYTYQDAVYDTAGNVVFRVGAAYLTGGYSEMVLNPISALGTMRNSIMQGDSTAWAVTKGFAQSGFELALGETGRLFKTPAPIVKGGAEAGNLAKLARANPGLSSEISSLNRLAAQGEEQITRNAFMNGSQVARMGKTAAYELNTAERQALNLNNNPEVRKLLAENSDLVPSNVKEVMGVAKQKVYQNARNSAIDDVMKQMEKDGVNTADKTFFIKQTGTHAQPGNPGWNSLKSDFDHTVDFGSSKYNQLYEQQFANHLESQGTSMQAMDANVYQGTSGPGAYKGGALKFVEHYNETTGSDIMIRNVKGTTTITAETPQSSTSLLSRMNAEDVQSAKANYQNFFQKDIAKAGNNIDNQIMNGSKTVSRSSGQYSTDYVNHYLETGNVGYQPPQAAQVADLIKKRGFTVDQAMQQAGYTGSKEQLLADFQKLMGL